MATHAESPAGEARAQLSKSAGPASTKMTPASCFRYGI